MSNLKLDLVTIQLPLDVRITEFKSDEDKMRDVNDFINEIMEKAKVEVEYRGDTEANTKLDAFGLQTTNIGQEAAGLPAGDLDVSDSDLWEDAAAFPDSSPRSSCAGKQNARNAGDEKLSWMKIANFPSTQQVIEECSDDCTSTSHSGPSILVHDEFPDDRPDNTSISPVGSCDENEPRTIKMIRLGQQPSMIELVAEVPSSQIEIEELLTQERRIESEYTRENSFLPLTPMFFTSMSASVSLSAFQLNSGENTKLCNQTGKFKKSSYAMQALRAIKEHRTRSDIWMHGWRQNHSEDEPGLKLYVRDEFVECGRCILVCENSVINTCLVLMEAGERNQPLNTLKGQWIKLFPPYSRKFIDYCGGFVSFYYNATRCVSVDLTLEQEF